MVLLLADCIYFLFRMVSTKNVPKINLFYAEDAKNDIRNYYHVFAIFFILFLCLRRCVDSTQPANKGKLIKAKLIFIHVKRLVFCFVI